MGNCPGTMIGPGPGIPAPAASRTKVPFELQSLAIAYEPIDVFRLLGFDNPNKVTPEEFKARVQERLAMLTPKKGGAPTEEEIQDLKELLDSLPDGVTEPSADKLKQIGIVDANTFYDVRKQLIDSEDDDELKAKYRTFRYPKPQQQQQQGQQQKQGSTVRPECKNLGEWVSSLESPGAITGEDIARSGLTKPILIACLPVLTKEYNQKFAFALETEYIPQTSACSRILNEASNLVTYSGSNLFNTFKKYALSRKQLNPKKPIASSSFIQTCKEIEKTIPSGYKFPVSMLDFYILRERVNPFNVLGLSIDMATKDAVSKKLTALQKILDEDTSLIKPSTPEFKTSCQVGLFEFKQILDANLLDSYKSYIKSRLVLGLFPGTKLNEDDFRKMCLTPPKPEPTPTPEAPKLEPTPVPVPEAPKPEPVPEPPNKECIPKVVEWLANDVNDESAITPAEVSIILNKKVTRAQLEECVKDISETEGRQISLPPPLPEISDLPKGSLKAFSPLYPPNVEPVNERCIKDVAEWLQNDVKDMTKITKKEVNKILRKSVTPEQLKACVVDIQTHTGKTIVLPDIPATSQRPSETEFPRPEELPPTVRKPVVTTKTPQPELIISDAIKQICPSAVVNWLSTVKDRSNITPDEFSRILKKVPLDKLVECIRYINLENTTQISLPIRSVTPTPVLPVTDANALFEQPSSTGGRRRTYRKKKGTRKTHRHI